MRLLPRWRETIVRPGLYTVGVRVLDNDGAPAFSSLDVRVSGPAAPANPGTTAACDLDHQAPAAGPFSSIRPAFGGRKRHRWSCATGSARPGVTIVSLYRGKKRIKRLSAGNRRANQTYKIRISPKKLRKGATSTRSGCRCAAPTASARNRRACRRSGCSRRLGRRRGGGGCAAGWPTARCATTPRTASRRSRSTSPRRATRSPTGAARRPDRRLRARARRRRGPLRRALPPRTRRCSRAAATWPATSPTRATRSPTSCSTT